MSRNVRSYFSSRMDLAVIEWHVDRMRCRSVEKARKMKQNKAAIFALKSECQCGNYAFPLWIVGLKFLLEDTTLWSSVLLRAGRGEGGRYTPRSYITSKQLLYQTSNGSNAAEEWDANHPTKFPQHHMPTSVRLSGNVAFKYVDSGYQAISNFNVALNGYSGPLLTLP